MARWSIAGLGILLAATLLAGCGGSRTSRSVLYEGVRLGDTDRTHLISDAAAKKAAHLFLADWKQQLEKRARLAPGQRFENLPRDTLTRRLYQASRRYDFRVESIELLRPRQLAPKIVVQTTHYLVLARALHAILKTLDPRAPAANDSQGWKYEGFYFEAQDERGVPFLAIDNYMRGEGGGGGQFARSEPLYPAPHS